MGLIFYIMGKSASGKDSIFRRLSTDSELNLKQVTMYTTRPMRQGEEEGREYFFRTGEFLEEKKKEGTLIECRTYQTVCGPWSYFTLDDGQFNPAFSYLMIGTPESYGITRAYFEKQKEKKILLVPLYIYVEDGERLLRAVNRERSQKKPNFAELCRRFLADEEDFAPDVLKSCGVKEWFENDNLEFCIDRIKKEIIRKIQNYERKS